MQNKVLTYLIFTLLLFACSPQVQSSPASNNEPLENEESVLIEPSDEETAVESQSQINEQTQEENESMNEPMDEDDTPIVPEETPIISRDNIAPGNLEQKSEPIVVDLGQLMTPEPSEEGDLVEQPAPGIPSGSAKLLHDVQMDLSSQLNVDISAITTVSMEEVMWRDSSLGCPAAGMSYLQVLTSGFRIILEVNGQSYHYHSRDTSHFVLCQNPQSPIPGAEPAPGLGDT